MNIETEVMENQGENIPYEQPSLKKYGTMKEFTLGSGGSGGDGMGRGSDVKTTIINPKANQNANLTSNDQPDAFGNFDGDGVVNVGDNETDQLIANEGNTD